MHHRVRAARRAGLVAVTAVSLVGVTACGTILYPERKGQVDGRIDPAVAVLDGIGLLFFLVPGVIAFAVDFATGAIYLPGSGYTKLDLDEADMAKLKKGELDAAAIERLIRERTGKQVSLADPALRLRREGAEAWQRPTAVLTGPQLAALRGGGLQAAR